MTAKRRQIWALRFWAASLLRRLAGRLDPQPIEALLFARRQELVNEVLRWCKAWDVEPTPINLITALHGLGRLPLKPNAQPHPAAPDPAEISRRVSAIRSSVQVHIAKGAVTVQQIGNALLQ